MPLKKDDVVKLRGNDRVLRAAVQAVNSQLIRQYDSDNPSEVVITPASLSNYSNGSFRKPQLEGLFPKLENLYKNVGWKATILEPTSGFPERLILS